jgi:hypothetical protein
MKFQQKNLSDLHKRLKAIMPEYKPISEYSGKTGTYKAINGDGNVFLITWTHDEGKPPHRSESFLMDYNTLLRKSDDKMARYQPEEGWDLTE